MKYNRALFCLLLVATSGLAGKSATAASLITNGGFETGDFTGWTLINNVGPNGVDNLFPHTGSYAAYFGQFTDDGLVSLTQNVAITPGVAYSLSFWVMAEANSGPLDEFRASFGGTSLLDLMNVDPFPYTLYSYTVTATSSSSLVQFDTANDTSFFDLDDVSLTPISSAVPEPGSLWLLGQVVLLSLISYGWLRAREKRNATL